MRLLRVAAAGPRTTVEDLGRRGVGRFGVPPGGAFDAVALAAANRIAGNPAAAAGLELTLRGPALVNAGDEPLTIAYTGAEFAASVLDGGKTLPIARGRAATLAPCAELRFAGPFGGARAWLAIAGGIEIASVLGSRSTWTSGTGGAGFGGIDGRPLRAGDVLPVGEAPRSEGTLDGFIDPLEEAAAGETVLRLLPGPQSEVMLEALSALAATAWRVARDSDRVGIRLAPAKGDAPAGLRGPAGVPPEGTTLGAVQLPADGGPIVLGCDRPVTGGYAKPALVARCDVGRLARLRPGDRVRFEPVTLERAIELAGARWAAAGGRP